LALAGITRHKMCRPLRAVAAFAVAALVGAAGAAAASLPGASTGPVTAIGPTTATVSGSVNPNGSATTWFVEYGTSTSYGSQTATTSAGSGTSSVAISPTLTGLKPGTSYHYRVVATSTAGTGRGTDGLLTTSAAPQAVTDAASSVTTTSATLNGTVNPSNRATTWYFEYGTSTSYGKKTTTGNAGSGTSAIAVAAPVTGLTSGRTYHFRLVATSDAGASRGSDRTFLASGAPTVTTKSASSVKDSTATLNASVNANGQATTVYFDYGTTTNYGLKTAAKSIGSGSGSTNVAIGATALTPSTVYHFRVVATNAAGPNTGSDQTFATTGPAIVRIGAATGISSNGATLTGSVDPSGHSTQWYFQYGLGTNYGLVTPAQSASSGGARSVASAIGGLTPGTAYHFRLVGTSSAGSSYSTDAVFTTIGPAVTLRASTATVIARHAVTLSGKVASGHPNESVALFAQRFGSGSFTAFATVLTDAGGSWRLVVRPPVGTTYKGVWNGSTSSVVTVSVRPGVTLRALSRLRFATHVVGARSFAGRTVQLQRHLLSGRWLTIARARLNSNSSAVFKPKLKRGRSTLRVAISVNQAGGGYLAGFSAWITIRRH
jgi:Fibronectin type III domain